MEVKLKTPIDYDKNKYDRHATCYVIKHITQYMYKAHFILCIFLLRRKKCSNSWTWFCVLFNMQNHLRNRIIKVNLDGVECQWYRQHRLNMLIGILTFSSWSIWFAPIVLIRSISRYFWLEYKRSLKIRKKHLVLYLEA